LKNISALLISEFNQEFEFVVIPGFQFGQFAFAHGEKALLLRILPVGITTALVIHIWERISVWIELD